MKKYTVMIIDDYIDKRLTMWTDFFTNRPIKNAINLNEQEKHILKQSAGVEYNMIYPQSGDILNEYIRDNKTDAYFLDVYLTDEDGWNIENALYSIKEYNPKAPIFVYSSQWRDRAVVSDVSTAFRNSFLGRTANFFYDTNEINSIVESFRTGVQTNRPTQLKKIKQQRKIIKDMIDSAFGKTTKEILSDNEDIVILHISDIQYGDKNMTDFAYTIWSEVKRVCQELQHHGYIKGIDLVAITGDIAMHGKKNEFKMARENMDEYLFKKLWPKESENEKFRERILMVPGNHDYDLNFCTLDYLNSENKEDSRTIDFEKAGYMLQDLNRKKINDYHDMGFAAFGEFAYMVTGNPIYIQQNHYNFIIDTFTNWGLKIICINTCDGISAEHTNGVKINKNDLTKIVNSFGAEDYECTTLILSHHSPNISDSLPESEKKKFQTNVTQLINSTKADLWLGGHTHISSDNEQKTSLGSIKILEAPTISLTEDWKTKEEKITLKGGEKVTPYRGFQIIILKKQKDNEREIERKIYMFDENGVAKEQNVK